MRTPPSPVVPQQARIIGALAVFVGGAVGTGIRAMLEQGLAPPVGGSWPWVTWWINVIGSAILGLLLGVAAVRPPLSRRRQIGYLALTTGLLGGFTTYSTFVLEAVKLADLHSLWVALAYAGSSVVVGVVAVASGYTVRSSRSKGGAHP